VALAMLATGCGGRVVGEPSSATDGAPDASDHWDSAPSGLADAAVGPVDADAGFGNTDAASPVLDSSADTTTGVEGGNVDGGDGLPSTADCLIGGNVLWVSGDPGSAIYPGEQTVSTGSTWSVSAEADVAAYDGALLEIHLPNTESPRLPRRPNYVRPTAMVGLFV
jgi:hypothetical protein